MHIENSMHAHPHCVRICTLILNGFSANIELTSRTKPQNIDIEDYTTQAAKRERDENP
jgi:hypothetical protein